MALVLKDRVKETTTTTGTGTLTLLGASTGYQSFAAIGNGNTCYYAISSTGGAEWEVGIGTYTASGTTLSRDTILESSSGGGVIDLSAGTKDVYVVYPAEKGVWLDASGNVVQSQFTSMNVTGTATINVATITSGTVSTTPSSATDIANKQYVDNLVASGITYHTPVKYEVPNSTGNLTATYNNGTGGVGATLTNAGTQTAFTPDGVVASVNDRVLIYNQTNAYENGVYTVTTVGSGSTNWVLTRATDADSYGLKDPNSLGEGDAFFITSGNTGAGETYVCNTQGTITFGTTAINFVQVSSAQIYSAGTGLTLSDTQFSITNTAVTPATYGTASQVPQIAINAQGQITSASNVAIAITSSNVSGLAASATTDTTNASNISSGTLANARTSASSSNGASTIVARDASGNFSANTITANVTGNISGSAATLTTARNFQISGGATAANVSFDGSAAVNLSVTAMNASVINTGTIANIYTTAASSNGASTIVARDASGNFTANNVSATNLLGSVTGSGAGLTSLNATAITSGTLTNARTTATDANGASTIVARDANGSFTANVGTFTTITGAGSGLTSLNASNLASGTVASARVSGSYTGITGVGTLTAGTWNASAISDAYLSTISTAGKVSNSATTASSSNGASTIVARDASGNFSANTITANLTGNASTATSATSATTAGTCTGNAGTATTLQTARTIAIGTGATGTATSFNGSADITIPITDVNASYIGTGTLANARTTAASANGASTIVARDASGNFAAGTITANLTGTASNATVLQTARNFEISGGATAAAVSFNGSAAVNLNVTAMNASLISAGTLPAARMSGSYTGITGVGTLTAGTWNASAISDTYLSTISTAGKVSNSATTASSTNGASTIVARDASGNFAAGTITANLTGTASNATVLQTARTIAIGTGATGTATSFNGSAAITIPITDVNASYIGTGTLANARTTASSSNGASTIVARDASGNFSAGTITATLNGNASTATSATSATSATTATTATQVSNALTAGTGITYSSGTTYNGSAAITISIPQAVGTASNVQFGSFGVGTAASGTSGEIRATNNITAYYSDERLKTKVGNIENALDKVKQIQTMYYHANETAVALGYDASILEVGVTAQSVQQVMPQTVAPAPIDEKYLTVRYERLVPLLIEAIKELEAQVAELKAK